MKRVILSLIHTILLIPALAQNPRLILSPIANGLTRPTGLAVLASNEFLVAQTNGTIRLIRNGVVLPVPFLNISSKISDPTWEGIFGLTLDPNYSVNGYVYVHYANQSKASVFSRFARSATNPDQVDLTSERILLTIPYPNPLGGHRSGHLGFGPDGYLYITTGDGSSGARGTVSAYDQQMQKQSQDMRGLYGKILRIDVKNGNPYTIPPTNPFSNPADSIPDEIFAVGLRNPWQWSFDRQTGDLWLGDVGQDGWDELNYTPAGTIASRNYGWPCFEGNEPYTHCIRAILHHPPLLAYPAYNYNGGKSVSITGGFVYRGTAHPDLRGWYIYGDFAQRKFWTLRLSANGTFQNILQNVSGSASPVAFGEGPDGELYVLSFSDGTLYRIGSQRIVSVQSGSWASPSPWNCSCLPAPNDAVMVSPGHTVRIDQPTSISNVSLNGVLLFGKEGRLIYPLP